MPINKTSPVWNYFYQDTPKTVLCTLCDQTLKYFGSTTNMHSHFKTKHGIPLPDDSIEGNNSKDNSSKDNLQEEEEDDLNKEQESSRSPSPENIVEVKRKNPKEFKKRSNVWKFFTQENPRGVRCNICNKLLKYCGSTTNMNSHLKCKHANDNNIDFAEFIPAKRDRKEQHSDDDDDDDYIVNTKSSHNNSEPRVSRSMALKQKVSPKNDSEEKITKAEVKSILLDSRKFLKEAINRMKPETELEIFGKYVAVQLEKLSPAQQLQAQKSIQNLLTNYRLKGLKKECNEESIEENMMEENCDQESRDLKCEQDNLISY